MSLLCSDSNEPNICLVLSNINNNTILDCSQHRDTQTHFAVRTLPLSFGCVCSCISQFYILNIHRHQTYLETYFFVEVILLELSNSERTSGIVALGLNVDEFDISRSFQVRLANESMFSLGPCLIASSLS